MEKVENSVTKEQLLLKQHSRILWGPPNLLFLGAPLTPLKSGWELHPKAIYDGVKKLDLWRSAAHGWDKQDAQLKFEIPRTPGWHWSFGDLGWHWTKNMCWENVSWIILVGENDRFLYKVLIYSPIEMGSKISYVTQPTNVFFVQLPSSKPNSNGNPLVPCSRKYINSSCSIFHTCYEKKHIKWLQIDKGRLWDSLIGLCIYYKYIYT